MTPRGRLRDVAGSVRARLKNLARDGALDFNLLLNRYTAERFLYRLSVSGEVDRFTLKGAALFRVWTERELRPTRDVDFLAAGGEDGPSIRDTMETICAIPCPEDGVLFDAGSIRIQNIRREQRDGGQRVRLQGSLGVVRLALQMDIGFGDVITPEREQQNYPTLLDLPVPRLWTYPRETMVAEKFEAMVSRGADNSRVKDIWDITCLARRFAFDGDILQTAIAETFRRYETSFAGERPVALLPGYYGDTARAEYWRVLQRQIATDADAPTRLVDAGEELGRFLGPVCDSLIDGSPFTRTWPAGGPWLPGMQVRREGETDG